MSACARQGPRLARLEQPAVVLLLVAVVEALSLPEERHRSVGGEKLPRLPGSSSDWPAPGVTLTPSVFEAPSALKMATWPFTGASGSLCPSPVRAHAEVRRSLRSPSYWTSIATVDVSPTAPVRTTPTPGRHVRRHVLRERRARQSSCRNARCGGPARRPSRHPGRREQCRGAGDHDPCLQPCLAPPGRRHEVHLVRPSFGQQVLREVEEDVDRQAAVSVRLTRRREGREIRGLCAQVEQRT